MPAAEVRRFFLVLVWGGRVEERHGAPHGVLRLSWLAPPPPTIRLLLLSRPCHHARSRGAYNGNGTLPWAGGDGSPEPSYPQMRYSQLMVPPVGTCADPINHATVQLLLSMLC